MELADLSSLGTDLVLGGTGAAGGSDDHEPASTSQLVLPVDHTNGGGLVHAAVSALEQDDGGMQDRVVTVVAAHVDAATAAHVRKVAAGDESLTDAALTAAPADPRAKAGVLSALSWRRICTSLNPTHRSACTRALACMCVCVCLLCVYGGCVCNSASLSRTLRLAILSMSQH
jgi:hypothetical protein